jgi:hypothetical protein
MKLPLNNILLILLLIAIIIILGQRGCISKLQTKLAAKCPEVSRIDTSHVEDRDTSKWYRPEISVIEGGRINPQTSKPTKSDGKATTEILFEEETPNYSPGADDYAFPVYYRDTARTNYGNIIIEDTVLGVILARRVTTDFIIPMITHRVTDTVKVDRPSRVKGFLSLSLQGSKQEYIQSTGVGFMLQFKNSDAIEVDGFYNLRSVLPADKWRFQLSYKKLISFRKK